MTIHVELGLSSALDSLLRTYLQPRQAEGIVLPAAPQVALYDMPVVAETPADVPPAVEASPKPEQQPEQAQKALTEVDVRAAVNNTYTRIIGPDWEDNPKSERSVKYKSKLKSIFKGLFIQLGAPAPGKLSGLPADKYQSFIDAASGIYVDNQGELQEPLPF